MKCEWPKAGVAIPWELRRKKRHKPIITRLRRANTVTLEYCLAPLGSKEKPYGVHPKITRRRKK
jgi:hypothetical protein